MNGVGDLDLSMIRGRARGGALFLVGVRRVGQDRVGRNALEDSGLGLVLGPWIIVSKQETIRAKQWREKSLHQSLRKAFALIL
jgi:hypothetical protein